MKLIDLYQKKFPICESPYKAIAENLDTTEDNIIAELKDLKSKDVLSRVGPVFSPNRLGVSSLAALKLPPKNLNEIAQKISELKSINHNYEREHEYNLWFVVTAEDQTQLDLEISKIKSISGQNVLVLPLLREFFIDLGFDINWSESE